MESDAYLRACGYTPTLSADASWARMSGKRRRPPPRRWTPRTPRSTDGEALPPPTPGAKEEVRPPERVEDELNVSVEGSPRGFTLSPASDDSRDGSADGGAEADDALGQSTAQELAAMLRASAAQLQAQHDAMQAMQTQMEALALRLDGRSQLPADSAATTPQTGARLSVSQRPHPALASPRHFAAVAKRVMLAMSLANQKELPTPAAGAGTSLGMSRTHGHSFDAFLSHNWGRDAQGRDNHARVAKISKALQRRGISTWFDDQGDMQGDM